MTAPGKAWRLGVKRAADLVVSIVSLVVLSPVIGAIWVWVRATTPGGAIFRQPRAGRHGRAFTIYKFHTMVPAEPGSALEANPGHGQMHVTPAGRLLRKTSLDELPQLVNIVKGDMSVVGPRPDLVHHAARYDERQRRRLEMRPGITGWAQVHGRNDISWDERIEMDVDYVERWSLRLDAEIVLKTIGVVLSGRGTELTRTPEGAR